VRLESDNIIIYVLRKNAQTYYSAGVVVVNSEVARLAPGKRVCLGEALAKTELFVVFVRLMQKLTFTVAPGHPKPTDQESIL
jgi:cytochrome P450